MFDVDQFIADCAQARSETDSMLAVKAVLDRALARSGDIDDALPATVAEFAPLYTSSEISIFKFVWGPAMFVSPHDHLIWATNGIYGGAEDNVVYGRTQAAIVRTGGR